MADRRVSGNRHEYEYVLRALRGDRRVDATRLADIQRGRRGHLLAHDRLEALLPLLCEQKVVVLQLGERAVDAEVDEQCPGARDTRVPVLLRIGLLALIEQTRLGEVQVGRRDHDVAVGKEHLALCASVLDPRRRAILDQDALDVGARHDRDAVLPCELRDRLDDGREPAHRVLHALGQV